MPYGGVKMNSARRSYAGGFCAVLLAAVLAANRADAGNAAPLFDVPRVDGIGVDGKPDDWGERGFRVEMIQDRTGEHKEPNDIDVRFRLGWDERGLLVLLSVRDDVHIENDELPKLYEKDSVEVYAATERGAADLYQVQIGPGMDPRRGELRHIFSDFRKDEKLAKEPLAFTIEQKRADGSYAMEMLLPWRNLGISPKDGVELAFQLVVNDNDGDGRITRLQWFPGSDTVSDSSVIHRIRLAKAPGPPVLAAASLSYEGADKLRVFISADERLDGSEISIVGADKSKLAAVSLKAKGGRARGEAILPYPLPESAGRHLMMLADGKQVGTIDEKLMPPPAPAKGRKNFGRGMARTMSLLAASTPEKRNRVKILFYGQSITVGDWWKMLTAALRNRYPYADLVIENRAIGGFGFDALLRTAEYDVYSFYPDLVILQAYGASMPGEDGPLERLITNIRKRTAAEIILCSHHVSHWRMDHGETPQYLKDDAKYQDDMDKESKAIEALAEKYDCEFIDVRNEWKRYMKDNDINSRDLLYGGHIHLNTLGNPIMAMLFERHFQYNPKFPFKFPDAVATQPVKPEKDGSVKLEFHGNRIDLLPGAVEAGDKRGSARVLIDGKPPSENPLLYVPTRPSKAPGAFWPAFMLVSHAKPLIIEDWILRVTAFAEKERAFEFEVKGSKTGPDGKGGSKEKFVSNSERVIIKPSDWRMFGRIPKDMMAPGKVEVAWSVLPQFLDVYTAPDIKDPALDHAVTLAQGLENGKHTLEIIPNGDGAAPIKAVRIYRPPMK